MDTAQLVKFVPHKHEDQGLSPRIYQVKKSGVAVCTYIASTGQNWTADPWGLLAGQPSLLGESQANEDSVSKHAIKTEKLKEVCLQRDT